ncbi:HEAT repeat domain-containing protein [Mycolicibacterium sp. GCM10028919]|uniref:HEAT repeat domain-containing protein n=1 Tax=Mycolicibacterium sp. GCM10028919 TaxID=3273401 RepID=UPI00360BF0A5
MADPTHLIEAAIRLDEGLLMKSGDAGAKHFAGVLRLDPRHLSDNTDPPGRISNEIEVNFSSLLFMVAESIRQVIVGREDVARKILADLDSSAAIERILIMLVQAWVPGGATTLAEIDEYVRGANIDPDLRSRIYMKLMTWELEARGRGPQASEYYDRAIENASEGLQQALYGVGETFGREMRLFVRPATDAVDTYSWIINSVSNASADELVRMARKQISPFGRTFGGDPSAVPMPVRAAELQGGWAGAYWVLERIWRVKASIILVNSRDPAERADAITHWVLSGGSRLRELVDENENILSRQLVSKVLVDDLKLGARVKHDDWVELCLALWDELPSEVSSDLIHTVPIPAWTYERSAPARENKSVVLFTALSSIDPGRWIERYDSIKPAQRLTVCLALSARQATALPVRLRREVLTTLLAYCGEPQQYASSPDVVETLAALVAELPDDAPERGAFIDILPAEFAAEIGVRYPQLTTADRIREELTGTVLRIQQQLEQNQRGQWSTFGTSLASEVARCLVALQSSDRQAIDTIVDFATAPASAANDVIDAVNALSWLADAGLLGSLGAIESRLPYRVDVSPVDKMWTGRDDMRAINAAIAGLHARLSDSRREAIALLVASTRDPDPQVRRLAMNQFDGTHLALGSLEASVDAAILGAVYDPDFRVQASALRAIRSISDQLVAEIAWARVASVWDGAHRLVRVSAAGMAAKQRYTEEPIERLREDVLRLASADRSFQVRRAAGNPIGVA